MDSIDVGIRLKWRKGLNIDIHCFCIVLASLKESMFDIFTLFKLSLGQLWMRLVGLSEFWADKHFYSFFGGKTVVFAWLLAEKGNNFVIFTCIFPFR